MIETPRFVTDAAVESSYNQADAFGWAIDAHTDAEAVESSRERACRERGIDQGDQATLASRATVRAVAGAKAGA